MHLSPAVIEIGIDPYIELGPLRLAWHGLMIAVGVVVGAWLAARYSVARRGAQPRPFSAASRARRPKGRARGGMNRAPLLLLLLAALLAGTLVPITSALPAASREARAARIVTVGDVFFSPASLSVRRGARVRWVWRGRLRHNVTVVRGPARFRSRTQRSGSYSRVLRRRGSYRLICTTHGARLQSMRIRVR